ncbi:SRPBCC family protein [Hamadaea tsunoensis]|uniref:SRPBCC family protein n=1 Tax=Hamadaea tsunoensis TaxID=53368 RepID=UPI00040F97C4|nr:SRPBCC domain-containing protein [Hamadaea tsunoensis]
MSTVEITVALPGVPAGRVIGAFTDPALVRQWWGAELTTDGTAYTAYFPALGQTMTGAVLRHEPDRFSFSWAWEHEPDLPTRRVDLYADGSALHLSHGPYADGGTEAEDRASHEAGWAYFLPRLSALLTAS